MYYNNKTFLVKRNSTYPLIKFPLVQYLREKYDITHEMLQNCAVTFSMFNEETGFYKIANVAADLVIFEDEYQFLDEPTYVLQYALRTTDTNEVGVFSGEFKLTFLGENCGIITLPSDKQITIIIQHSLTKVGFSEEFTTPPVVIPPSTPSFPPYFYGTFASGGASVGVNRPAATDALVKSGTIVHATSDGTITVNFNSDFDDYLFLAIPASSTPKTVWYAGVLNNGTIGGAVSVGGNLFPDPEIINVNLTIPLLGVVEYQVYISNFQTEALTDIEFRNA